MGKEGELVVNSKEEYEGVIKTHIEEYTQTLRYSSGRKYARYKLRNCWQIFNFGGVAVYDVNKKGTFVTARREGIEDILKVGLVPFSTPVNEGLLEFPAIDCGFVKDGGSIVDTETFNRNYGNLFNSESEGFAVIIGSDVVNAEDCKSSGITEMEIRRSVNPNEFVAIIVGNEKMFELACHCIKEQSLDIPVIFLDKDIGDS
jgi:hypothetical protein